MQQKMKRKLIKLTRFTTLAAIILFLAISCMKSSNGNLSNPYTNPAQFTSLPFGTNSHWLQPWRAYLETVPATKFLDGIGIVFKPKQNPELIAQMLAKHGIRRARFEIGWSSVDYDDETKLKREAELRARLLALKKFGIRPLILLNANHGRPCPVKSSKRILTKDANAGDIQIHLKDVSELRSGYSGLFKLTKKGWAAEYLITKISGNTVELSKPLPKDIKAGTSVSIARRTGGIWERS